MNQEMKDSPIGKQIEKINQAGLTLNDLMAQSTEIRPRWKICGNKMPRYDSVNKKDKTIFIQCGDFRNCDNCLKNRKDHYKSEIARLAELGTKFFAMMVDNNQNGKFNYQRKKYGAVYMKLPINSEQFIAIVDKAELCDVKSLDFQPVSLDSLDMTIEQYIAIPEGTRITGKLFRPVNWKEDVEEEIIENSITVKASQFVSDADDVSLANAEQLALDTIADELEEVTGENVQRAMDILIGTMKRVLLDKGFYVQSQGYKNQKIAPQDVSWDLVQINRIKPKHINRYEQSTHNNSELKRNLVIE